MASLQETATAPGTHAAGDPVVSLVNLSKRRERGGVAFELVVPELIIHRGEFVAVVGASGCGKSTLLDMLALVLEPDEAGRFEITPVAGGPRHNVGELWRQNAEIDLASLRARHFGYVLQTGGLLPFLTVEENIDLPRRILGRSSDGRLRDLVNRIGIGDWLRRKPQYLSGGQRQRVSIVRALGHSPALVLADEPTAAVDFERAEHIVSDLLDMTRAEQKSVCMVTHDRNLVRERADRFFTFEVHRESEAFTRSTCYEIGRNELP